MFAVARIVFAPVGGRAISRCGEVPGFCIGLAVVAASSAACAFATGFSQLLIFRAAGGLGSTIFTVSAAALVIRMSPAALRGRASGAWATGFLSGNIAGPVIGGWLISANPRAPFLGYTGILLVTALVTGVVLRGRIAPRTSPGLFDAPTVRFADAVCHPAFRAALIANVVNGWTVYGVRVALVPLFVIDALHGSSGWSGCVLAAFAAGTGATLLVGGRSVIGSGAGSRSSSGRRRWHSRPSGSDSANRSPSYSCRRCCRGPARG